MNPELIRQYAEFAVKIGVNPQPGQTLLIQAPIESAVFARACAEAGYDAGAREVVVHYSDEKLSRIKMEHTAVEVLEDVKPWIQRSKLDYVQSEGGACALHIIAEDPEIYKGLDAEKIGRARQAMMKAQMEWRSYTMNDRVQWCVVAIPSPAWAARVFPGVPEDEAMEKLWDAIFDVCRVKGGHVVEEWQEHIRRMSARRDHMNELGLDSVRLQSANGTDLVVGLAEDAVWEGAQAQTPEGYRFIANIPTEEVFTAPHRARVNGVVKGTKPYVYNGNLIEDFSVTFRDGRVVEYSARRGEELLGQLLDTDEGARRIGEIALVPVSSPINRRNLLFYNTLFDENAACHIAFGKGYPGTVAGGSAMTTQQLLEKGVNDSLVHEDVMVGAADMTVTGTTKTGETVKIFENGEWAF